MKDASVLFDYPGPKAARRHRIIGIVGTIILVSMGAGLIYGLRDQLTWNMWKPVFTGSTWTAYLLPGLLNTLKAAALAVVFSLILGTVLGIGRLNHRRWVRYPFGVIVELFRAVPVLMMMLFSYYAFRALNVLSGDLLSLAGVVMGLTLYNSAVIAELIRAGVHSLPHGQFEAGQAIGLTRNQTMLQIQLPQAVSAMMPSLVAQLIVVLKDTTLGTMISYSELLRTGGTINAVYGNIIVIYFVIGTIFFALNYGLRRLAEWFESRARRHETLTPFEPPAPDIDFIQDDLPQVGRLSGWSGAIARVAGVLGAPGPWVPKPQFGISGLS